MPRQMGLRAYFWATALWVTTLLMADVTTVHSAALLSGLSGHETPVDQVSDPFSDEFRAPGEVISGVLNIDDDPGNATAFISTYGGGLVALRYSPSYGDNRIIDREYSYGNKPIYALEVRGANSTGSSYIDTLFLTATDGNATPSYYIYEFSSNGTGLSPENFISLPSSPLDLTCSRKVTATAPKVVFVALEQGVFGWNASFTNNDTLTSTVSPTAISFIDDLNATGTSKDYLVVGWQGGEVDVYEVKRDKIGDANVTNGFVDLGLTGFVDGTPRVIHVFQSEQVDSNDTSSEALIFVGTEKGIHLFELDDNGSNPFKEVFEDKGDLTGWLDIDIDVRDIHAESAGYESMRDGFLIVAAGSRGTVLFKTSGDANPGTSLSDSFYIQYVTTFGTTSQALEVVGTGGTVNASKIPRIYVAEAGGGLKVITGENLDSPGQASLRLLHEWDPGATPLRIDAYKIGGSHYALIMDLEGGLRLYDIDASIPRLIRESDSNSTSGAVILDSSQSSGQPMDLFSAIDSSNDTTIHSFISLGQGGISYRALKGIGTPNFRFDDFSHFDVVGEALGIHGFQNTSGDFTLSIALGSQGVKFLGFDPSTATFEVKSTVVLGGSARDVFLIHDQGGEDYAYVAYGALGLYVFKITPGISGSQDFLTNPELVGSLSSEAMGGAIATKVKVMKQGSRYYAYVVGNDGRLYSLDVTNPSSLSFLGIYPANNTEDPGYIQDIYLIEDSENEKYYCLCASQSQSSQSDSRRLLFTLNVTDPSNILMGSRLAVDPTSPIFYPISIGAVKTGPYSLIGIVGAGQNGTGPLGLLGKFSTVLTGVQQIQVSLSLDSCPASPGETVFITPVVSGGYTPYTYNWSPVDIKDEGTGIWSWTAPQGPGSYEIKLEVTDSDGNRGVSTRTCTVEYAGLTIDERIATPNSTVKVPVKVSGVGNSIDAWGMEIQYDSTYLDFLRAESTDDTLGWSIAVEDESRGTLRIGGLSNGHLPIAQGVSAQLCNLVFSVKDVGGYGTGTCLQQEISANINVNPLNPSQLMGDLQGVEMHGGKVKIVLPGDIDGDLCVTPQDALNSFLGFLGVLDLREDQKAVGDVDGDGQISPEDAVMILDRYLR
ncbi:cohesin domain-containing protein [Dissulfuribacter thermophilus]|nr:cohesin domain-containing protein [Dissulfuribacter thermophilus]